MSEFWTTTAIALAAPLGLAVFVYVMAETSRRQHRLDREKSEPTSKR